MAGWLAFSLVLCGFAYGENLYWMGTNGSDWNTAANWDPAQVPGAADSVTIASATNMPTLAGNAVVTGVTITTGTLTVDGTLTTTTLFQSGGTLTGTGAVTANTITWQGGTMSGGGSTVVAADGTLTLSSTSNHYLDGRALVNDGSFIYSGASFTVKNSGSILNSGTFDFQVDRSISYSTPRGTFVNNGTLKKSAGTGTSTIELTFTNNGAVQIDSGILSFSSGGLDSESATYAVPSGATLKFTGSKSFANGLNVTGSGTVDFSSGTFDFGSKEFTLPSEPALIWSGGTLTNGTVVIPSEQTLTLTSTNHYLDGAVLINNGSFIYSGYYLYPQNNASIVNNGTFDMPADRAINSSGVLGSFVNNGTLKKSGGTGNSTIRLTFTNNGAVKIDSGILSFSSGGLDSETATYAVVSGATLQFAGSKSFANGLAVTGTGTLDLHDGTLDFGGKEFTLPSNLSLIWSGGTLTNGTILIPSDQTLTMTSTNHHLDGAVLINNGTFIYSGYYLYPQSNASIVNNGIFDMPGDRTISSSGVLGSFTNNGTLKKSGGTGTSTISLTFTNNGAVQIDSGILSFSSAGLDSEAATYAVASGTTLRFAGSKSFANGLNVTGSGTVDFSSGAFDFGGKEFTLPSELTLFWNGGTMYNGTVIVPAGQTLNMVSGTQYLNSCTLINNGSMIAASSYYLQESNSSQIVNNGVFDIQTDYDVKRYISDMSSFTNNGTLKKSAGTGTSTIQLTFTNNGTVQIDSGTLSFSSGGMDSESATYAVASGATLRFAGPKSFANGLNVTGEGTVDFSGGTFDFGGKEITLPSEPILVWSGGTLTNGTLIIPSDVTLTVSDYSSHSFDGCTLTNNGSVIVSVDFLYEKNNGRIVNNGIFDFQGTSSQIIHHYSGTLGSFTNTGTLKKSIGTDIAYIQLPCTNNGTIQADSGTLSFNAALENTSTGRVRGSAALNLTGATYTNAGTTQPGNISPGKLSVTGNYPLPAESNLTVRLGGTEAGTSYDQLAVSGNVTLGGVLNVALVDPFVPAAGESFTILTSGGTSGITGTFAKLNLPELPTGAGWQLAVNESSVVLTVNPIAVASVTPLTRNFGSVFLDESSIAETFTVDNRGSADLVIDAIAFSGTNADMFTLDATADGACGTLPATLAPGASCTVEVVFAPTVAEVAEASLVVTSNDPKNPELSVPLAGTGLYKLTATRTNNYGTITGPTGSLAGGEATFTITANDGYRIDSLTDNGEAVTPAATQAARTFAYKLTDISEHHVIEVTFAEAFTGIPGDCDNNGQVSITEIQLAINMYLGLKEAEACVDTDGNGGASIAEVQKVINGYLNL